MNIVLAIAVSSVVVFIAGCATSTTTPEAASVNTSTPTPAQVTTAPAGPAKIYNGQEYKMMTYCVGISDSASHIAAEKLKGTPKATIQQFYFGKPQSVLNLATVDKVYNETVTSVWDYSVNFFNECANNLAKVPAARINMASYCMQNQLIADVTHAYKTAGAPKDDAYTHFEKFNPKTTHSIIDKVYSSSQTRADIKLEIWNSCMALIADKPT
jgi:hypothetical protein